jgi:hypothetical protein
MLQTRRGDVVAKFCGKPECCLPQDFAATFSEPSVKQISRQISRQADNYLVVHAQLLYNYINKAT